MASLLRCFTRSSRRWKPLNFSNQNFLRIPAHEKVEEETHPRYVAEHYYPTKIGEIIQNRYQVVGKLGWGSASTVWLARDLDLRRHVSLKVQITDAAREEQVDNELMMYDRMVRGSSSHPGREYIRALLDTFKINGPHGQHRCFVHTPLWDDLDTFISRFQPSGKIPTGLLAITLRSVFLALDFLHTECQIIHTDISGRNIMLRIIDDSIFSEYEQSELEDPSPRKELEDRTIYYSHDFPTPKSVGAPVLCDFGSAVLGDKENTSYIQPRNYCSPESMLTVPWSYSVDIWNLGCVMWDLYEGTYECGSLFTGDDDEFKGYRIRAHLAEIISFLGPPPPSFVARGKNSHRWFNEKGEFSAAFPVPECFPRRRYEETNTSEDKEQFMRMIERMIKWEPEKRSTARELLDDEFIAWVRNCRMDCINLDQQPSAE